MFEKLGSLIVKRRRLIFSLFMVAIFSAGAIGSSVFGKLDSGGYNDPKSDSAKAFEYLTELGAEDLIKTKIEIDFSRGERAKAAHPEHPRRVGLVGLAFIGHYGGAGQFVRAQQCAALCVV